MRDTTAGASSLGLGYSPSSAPALRASAAVHFAAHDSIPHSNMGQQASSPQATRGFQKPRVEDNESLFIPRASEEATTSRTRDEKEGGAAYGSTPPPESSDSDEPSTRPTRPARHRPKSPSNRRFMPKVAKTGYWEDRYNKYPDVNENAEGGGIRCETETDSDESVQSSPTAHRSKKSGGKSSGSRRAPRRARNSTVGVDTDKAADFNKAKAIYEAKVSAGTATTEDLIWFSGLEADEKKRLKKLEEAQRGKTESKRQAAKGKNDDDVVLGSSSLSTPSKPAAPKKYGMFSQPWMSPRDPGHSGTSSNSATASGVMSSNRRNRNASPHTPSRRPHYRSAQFPTPSTTTVDSQSEDELSFGIVYRIDEETNEVMIAAGHVANMVLQHHRSGALRVATIATPTRRAAFAPEDELSLGAVYRLDPETEEVMIPVSYAKNLVLIHQRSGALHLSPGSQPSPLKRRRADDDTIRVRPRRSASPGRRPRGRPKGSKNRRDSSVAATGSSSVGTSASRPVMIPDDSDTDAGE